MRKTHDEILFHERKKEIIFGTLLNFLLMCYLSFSVLFIFSSFTSDELTLPSLESILWALPVAFLVTLVWSQMELSTGRVLIKNSSRYLKNELKSKISKKWWISFSGILSIVLFVVTIVLGVQITEMSFGSLLSEEGMLGARRIFFSLLNPNWEILGFVLSKMVETIFIALMATLLAIPIAFIASFFSARNLTRTSFMARTLYAFFRFISNFTRSVEPIIWAIIFSVWVGIGPFAGMLALMLHSIASLMKLYSEQIESIDHGPIEAIEATGANKIQTVMFAVVPQIVLPFLSFTIYRWDINIRMATIIGLVGGGGVGTLLMQYQGLAKWNEVGTIVLVIAVVVWIMDYLSAKLRESVA